MKATEIEIGDYLVVLPSKMVIKVAAVHNKKVGYHAVTNRLEWVRIGLLRPIRIIPEILEKNGFTIEELENGTNCTLYIKDNDGHGVFKIYWWNDFLDIKGYIYGINNFNGYIKYVHELQHAIRLCRIEKEITL